MAAASFASKPQKASEVVYYSDLIKILRFADVLSLAVLIIYTSHAWIYPSLLTTDQPPGIAAFNILFLMACLYSTLRLVLTDYFAIFKTDIIFVIIIFLGSLSFINSVSQYNTFGMIRTATLFMGACLFLRYRFTTPTLIRAFVDIIGVIMVLSAFAALFTSLGVMTGYDAGRWRGLFSNKNSLGEYAGLFLIVQLSAYFMKLRFTKRNIVYALCAFACLIMADSATATGILFFSIFVFAVTTFFERSWLKRSQAMFMFSLLTVGIFVAAYSLIAFVTLALGRDLTFTGRTGIWEQFIYFANQRPLLGWGWATIGTNDYMLGYIRRVLQLPYIQTPHNAYLSIIVEIGYPACAVYLLWLVSIIVRSSAIAIMQRDDIHVLRLTLVMGLTLHNFFESTAGVIPSPWLLLLFATAPLKRPSSIQEPASIEDLEKIEAPSGRLRERLLTPRQA